jgi:polar amino acid transport system substrate-binding protein
MRRIIVAFLIVAGALAWHGIGPAVAADPEPRRMLAPSGTLRAGLYPGTPTSILPDAGSGEPRGVGYDLGKALARRLGVPYQAVVFAKNAEVLAAVKSGEVDVAFTNATAVRARDMDFGPPFLEIELGYLVPRGSALTTPAEVDAPGLRVGVTAGSSSDATLSRDFKLAQIVRAATFDVAIEMMSTGAIRLCDQQGHAVRNGGEIAWIESSRRPLGDRAARHRHSQRTRAGNGFHPPVH